MAGSAQPVVDHVTSEHAAWEMARRGLTPSLIGQVLMAPEQRYEVWPGRVVVRSRVGLGLPEKLFLVRVIVDIDRKPAEVVTAYRTTKIVKYWRQGA